MATAKEAAEWMASEFHAKGRLVQSDAVREIKARFGEEVMYKNENGNDAIAKPVLKEFRALAPDAIWDRWGFEWCKPVAAKP